MWLQTAFAIPESAMRLDANTLSAAFTSLRDGKPMVIEMAANGRMTVATESMEAAGEVVQEIAAYLQMTELESVANFPAEMAAFEEVLAAVDEFNQTRLKLTAEMADSSNLLKSLVIKAEVTTPPHTCLGPRTVPPPNSQSLQELPELISMSTAKLTNYVADRLDEGLQHRQLLVEVQGRPLAQ